jgi:hypothetical protein
MITKGKLTDQILRLYSGGNPSDDKEISREDVNILVGQVINRLLKTDHVSGNMGTGELFPPHTLISTYIVKVEEDKITGLPIAYLPVHPINLPRNMGVWSVETLKSDVAFIPLQSGQGFLYSRQDQLRFLEGQVGYWVEGSIIHFGVQDVNIKQEQVKLKLLIVDPTIIGEYDYLALPADLEEGVIKECLTMLGALPKQVDKVSDSNNQL